MKSSNSEQQTIEAIAKTRQLFFHQADGYAEMWKARDGRIGYSPVCRHGKPWSCGQQDLIEARGPRCGRNCHSFSPVPLTDEAIARHLAGKVTLGAYLLAADNTCKAGVIDCDINKDADPDANRPRCRELVRLVYRTCRGMDLSALLEDSGNKGYHLWTFFSEPMPAGQVQRMGRLIVARALEEQEFSGIHAEVFPKQGEKDHFGNLIKVPLSLHLKTGRRCLFLDPETFEPYPDQTGVLLDIEPNFPERVREVLEEYEIGEAPGQESSSSDHGFSRNDRPAPVLVDDPVGAILENCARADGLRWKTKEEQHLTHDERIFLANLFGSVGQAEWTIENIFSCCSDFDPAKTEKHFASLNGKGPLCAHACPELCEKIRALDKKSPVAFAYKRGKDLLPDPDSLKILLTEYGNAQRLKAILQERIAFSPGFGWMLYNPETGVWENEPGAERICKLVTRTLRQLLEAEQAKKEAELELLKAELKALGTLNLLDESPPEVKKKANCVKEPSEYVESLGKWIKTCENHNKIAGTLKFAEGLFWIKPTIWDSKGDLLVCGNGVLNLEMQEFTSFSPSCYATKRTPVPWNPGATHPVWDRVLDLLKQEGDRYERIRRICGSLLYAGNPNEIVVIFEGGAGTGKGTLITAIHKAMGDYAQSIDITSLLETDYRYQGKGAPRADLFKLRATRFVFTGEPPKNAKLDAGGVKKMSGNDPIDARQPYAREEITFYPLYKIVIQTNFPIRIEWDDEGMERRLVVVPFNVKPE